MKYLIIIFSYSTILFGQFDSNRHQAQELRLDLISISQDDSLNWIVKLKINKNEPLIPIEDSLVQLVAKKRGDTSFIQMPLEQEGEHFSFKFSMPDEIIEKFRFNIFFKSKDKEKVFSGHLDISGFIKVKAVFDATKTRNKNLADPLIQKINQEKLKRMIEAEKLKRKKALMEKEK